jgi:hypothetical protein
LCAAYPAPAYDDERFAAFLLLVGRLGARAQSLNAGPIAKNRFAIDLRAVNPPEFVVGQNLYFLALATGRRAMLDGTDFGAAIDAVTMQQLSLRQMRSSFQTGV